MPQIKVSKLKIAEGIDEKQDSYVNQTENASRPNISLLDLGMFTSIVGLIGLMLRHLE